MISEDEWYEFHQHLVQEIADFLKDKDLGDNPWEFRLTVDDIPSLIKYGEWTPRNDSYMGLLDDFGNEILYEM